MEEIQEIASSGHSIFDSAIVMAILATVAVIVRFISKACTKARYSYDDFGIGFSLAAFWAYVGLLCWAVFEGGGGLDMPYIKEMELASLSLYIEALMIASTFFVLVTSVTKISILLYYRRIFTTPMFKRAVLVLSLVTAAAWLTAELGIILQCNPLKHLWDPLVQGHCINFDIFFLVIGLVDLILDVSVLCLPLRMIPRLKLPLKHRINLSIIFLLGGFVCVTAIVRMAICYQTGQTTINFVKGILWSNIHLGTAIICACLPTYRPLLSRCADGLTSMQRQYKQIFSHHQALNTSTSVQPLAEDSKGSVFPAKKVSRSQDDQEQILGNFTGARGEDWSTRGVGGYPLNQISVKSTMSVV